MPDLIKRVIEMLRDQTSDWMESLLFQEPSHGMDQHAKEVKQQQITLPIENPIEESVTLKLSPVSFKP